MKYPLTCKGKLLQPTQSLPEWLVEEKSTTNLLLTTSQLQQACTMFEKDEKACDLRTSNVVAHLDMQGSNCKSLSLHHTLVLQ